MATRTYNLSHVVITAVMASLISALVTVTVGIPISVDVFSPYTEDKSGIVEQMKNLNGSITRIEGRLDIFLKMFQSHESRISTLEGQVN